MGKFIANAVFDAAFAEVTGNCNKICITDAEPAAYASCVLSASSSGNLLADVSSITASDFTGPADGSTDGRKLTVDAQSSISVDATGSATHIVLVDTTSSGRMLVGTTLSATKSLTVGNKVDMPSWEVRLRDPS